MAPGDVRRAAVLGKPISHSLSPALHRAAYRVLGLNWTYDAIEMDAAGLPAFVAGLDAGWAGLSLTMPCKTAVIPLIDSISELAGLVGTVNTVLPRHGRLVGENTDIYGIVQAIGELQAGTQSTYPRGVPSPVAEGSAGASVGQAGFPGSQTPGSALGLSSTTETSGSASHTHGLSGERALLLGAGATARSALAALAQMGVSQVGVSARRPRAAADLEPLASQLGLAIVPQLWLAATPGGGGAWDELLGWLGGGGVISTLPAAAWSALPTIPATLGPVGWLLDVSYAPDPPPLVTAWRQAGGVAASGLTMLLWQAVEQVRLMTGRTVDAGVVAAMRAALPS